MFICLYDLQVKIVQCKVLFNLFFNNVCEIDDILFTVKKSGRNLLSLVIVWSVQHLNRTL